METSYVTEPILRRSERKGIGEYDSIESEMIKAIDVFARPT